MASSKPEAIIVGGSNNSALDNAASDANQNLSSAPAGSPVQSCDDKRLPWAQEILRTRNSPEARVSVLLKTAQEHLRGA